MNSLIRVTAIEGGNKREILLNLHAVRYVEPRNSIDGQAVDVHLDGGHVLRVRGGLEQFPVNEATPHPVAVAPAPEPTPAPVAEAPKAQAATEAPAAE